MKRIIIFPVTVALALALATTALAASLGISPSHIELEVPAEGSVTADLQVHYFRGDVQVSLVDIPLRVKPEILHVDALAEPEDIELTIYGDESLGSQVYEGFIKFFGMSGEMIAIAVQVKAKITNIVEGQPVPESTPDESQETEVISTLEGTQDAMLPESSSTSSPTQQQDAESLNGIGGLSLNVVILMAGGLVFLGLIILAISLTISKRRRN